MFNKYFDPSKCRLKTNIVLRFRVEFSISSPEHPYDSLSECGRTNWIKFQHRNSNEIARLIEDTISTKLQSSLMGKLYWNERFDVQDNYLELILNFCDGPQPSIIPCRTDKCPYKNYFGVCRNCEDELLPSPIDIESHIAIVKMFSEQLKGLEEEKYIGFAIKYQHDLLAPILGNLLSASCLVIPHERSIQ